MCVIVITTIFNVFSTCVSLSTTITMFVMQIMNNVNIYNCNIHMYSCTIFY